MSRRRKIWFLGLLVVATLFAQSVSAACYLPGSSYENGAWQGSLIYEENENVLIDFVVYDTDRLHFAHETALADQFNIAGQYIYTYQIFNRPDEIHDEIYEVTACFSILDIDGDQIDEALLKGDTGCHSDCSRVGAPARQHRYTQRLWGRIHDAVPIY